MRLIYKYIPTLFLKILETFKNVHNIFKNSMYVCFCNIFTRFHIFIFKET